MTSSALKIDPKQLQTLIPLNALTPSNFTDVTSKATIETVGAKRYLFKIGDGDEWTTYILKGKVSLLNAEGKVIALIEGGSGARSARHPLDPQHPHTCSARAETEITCLRVNSNLLDLLLTWDQSSTESGYEVDEPEENWMSRLLQSPIFQQIPAINIPKIIAAMNERPVRAGEVIVQQHDVGDYYYYIQEGRCEVVRQTIEGHEEKLAELGHGATFGEEALLSDARRNATVRMLTAGSLMTLAKADFVELIKAPLEHEISYARSKELIEAGATWIDVRLREEYKNSPHFANSSNLPLQELRELAKAQLDEKRVYIVCCDTGRRATAGAFILNQLNFHAYALRGGLHSLPDSIEWASSDVDETPTAIAQTHDWTSAAPAASPPPIIPDDTLKIAHQLQEKAELARKKADAEVAKLKQLQLEANEKLSQAAKIRAQADAKLKQAHLLQQQLQAEQQNQAQQSQKQQHLLKIAKAEALKLRAEREQLKAETAQAQAELERARLEMAIAQQTQVEAQRQLEIAQQLQNEAETTKQTATAAKDETQALSLEMQEHWQQEIAQLKQKTAQAETMAQQALEAQQAAALKLQQAEQLNANALAAQQTTADAAEKIHHLEQQINNRNQQLLEATQAQKHLAASEQLKAQQLEAEAEALRAEQARLKAEMEQLQNSAQAAKQEAETAQHTLSIAQQKLQEAHQLTLDAEKAKQTAEVEATETRAFAADMQQKIQQEVERLQQQATYTAQMTAEAEQAQQQAALKLQEAERLKAEAEAAQQATAAANQQLAELEQQIQLKLQQEQAAAAQLKAEVEAEKRALQQETEKLKALQIHLQSHATAEGVVAAEPTERTDSSTDSSQDILNIKALQEQAAQKLREAEQLKVLAEKTREAATQEANRIRLEHEQAYRQLQQEVQQLQSQLSNQHSQQEETANIRQEYETLKREREQMQAVVAHANQKLQEAMRLKTQAQTQHAHPVVYPTLPQPHQQQQLEQAVRLKTEAEAAKSVAKAEIGRIDHALKQSQQVAQLKSSLDTTSAQVASLKEAKDTIDNLKKSLEQARQRAVPEPDLSPNAKTHTRWIGLLAACLALLITGVLLLKSQWSEFAQQFTAHWHKAATPAAELQPDAQPKPPENPETTPLTTALSPVQPTPVLPSAEEKEEAAPVSTPDAPLKQPIVMGKLFRDPLAGSEQNFGPSMITIAAGSFTMGNTLSTAYPEERPPRTVAIPAFAISQYEISFDEYEVFTHHTGQRRPEANGWGTHRRPVINVSWQEASDYASWLSKQTRHNYRLPTEAEWEYAAGAGQDKLYWWGNRLQANIANCYDCGSIWDGKKTAPIGSFAQNPFGLFDVAGNVAEWVQDCDHPTYIGAPTDNRVWLSGDCAKRIVRGGSYRSPSDQLITTRRKALLSTTRADHLGFRLVREN